jgi:hypothetical protein
MTLPGDVHQLAHGADSGLGLLEQKNASGMA